MTKKSVIILIRALNVGGGQRQAISLIRGLLKQKFMVGLCTFYSGGELFNLIPMDSIKTFSLGKNRRWDLLISLWALIKFIKKEQPAILISFFPMPNIFAAFIKLLFPKIRLFWRVGISFMDLKKFGLISRLLYLIEAKLSFIPDLIIVNSEAGMRYCFKSGFKKSSLKLIHNGIDTDRFRFSEFEKVDFRRAHSISNKTFVLGTVSRPDPMKDYGNLLEAIKILLDKGCEIPILCVFVGDDNSNFSQDYKKMAEELGVSSSVKWLPASKEIEKIYSGFDLFVLSSKGEGMPNALCEAMASGIPSITTDVGNAAFIVEDKRFVVPPQDPKALSERILWFLSLSEQERKLLGESCRKNIISRFSIDVMTRKITVEF